MCASPAAFEALITTRWNAAHRSLQKVELQSCLQLPDEDYLPVYPSEFDPLDDSPIWKSAHDLVMEGLLLSCDVPEVVSGRMGVVVSEDD